MNDAIKGLIDNARNMSRMWKEKAEEEQRFAGLLADLAPGLPPDLPYCGATQHEVYGGAAIQLAVDAYADSRRIIEALPPVPAATYRDGCLSFRPSEYATKYPGLAENDRGTRTPIFPVWANFQNVTGPVLEVEWYAKVNGILVRASCQVKQVYQLANWGGTRKMSDGHVYLANKWFRHKLTGERVNWWTSDDCHMKVTVYWKEGATLDNVFTVKENAQ